MTVGRVAYTIIKEALPYSKFDKLLLTMSLCDTDIGNINHSRFFVTNFLDNFIVKNALSEELVNTWQRNSYKQTAKCKLALLMNSRPTKGKPGNSSAHSSP